MMSTRKQCFWPFLTDHPGVDSFRQQKVTNADPYRQWVTQESHSKLIDSSCDLLLTLSYVLTIWFCLICVTSTFCFYTIMYWVHTIWWILSSTLMSLLLQLFLNSTNVMLILLCLWSTLLHESLFSCLQGRPMSSENLKLLILVNLDYYMHTKLHWCCAYINTYIVLHTSIRML